jgi:hypothetical protein
LILKTIDLRLSLPRYSIPALISVCQTPRLFDVINYT